MARGAPGHDGVDEFAELFRDKQIWCIENANTPGPGLKKSFCFAPGVPVFLQKKKCLLYPTVCPPSTDNVLPVMLQASSDAK